MLHRSSINYVHISTISLAFDTYETRVHKVLTLKVGGYFGIGGMVGLNYTTIAPMHPDP